MRTFIFASIFITSALRATPTRADDSHTSVAVPQVLDQVLLEKPPPIRKPKTRWYGWQTIALLGVGDGIITAGAAMTLTCCRNAYPVMIGGFVVHALTPMAVQIAHGRPERALLSLGITAGMTALFAGAGFIANEIAYAREQNSIDPYFVSYGYQYTTAVLGAFLAPIIDIAAFSTEPADDQDKPRYRIQNPLPINFNVMPMIGQKQNGIMLVGQF